jgi:hypothetical protein
VDLSPKERWPESRKRGSASLLIREMQLKATMRVATILKTIKLQAKPMEKLVHVCIVGATNMIAQI